jgi:hypothetical protein
VKIWNSIGAVFFFSAILTITIYNPYSDR